jgi:UPF0755 protein
MLVKVARIILVSAALLLLFFTSWFSLEFYRPSKALPKMVIFEVTKGQAGKDIARNLKKNGIIKKTWPLLLGYKIFFSSQSLKAGEYALQLPLSAKDVLQILTEGTVLLRPVTIPEGLIIEEIADLLESQGFAKKADIVKISANTSFISSMDKEATSLEGYLFPETYSLAKDTTADEIVSAMIFQFTQVFCEKWKHRAEEIGMSVREIVILASLIEKETSLPEERKLVSAVFHNRLKRGMKLDCDPTIIYVLKREGNFGDRLRTKDLKLNSPFNTYLYPGLPPGPISNPGEDSLEAALYPAEENYLYFVSKNDGSHHFSSTFREHQRAVNTYQRR